MTLRWFPILVVFGLVTILAAQLWLTPRVINDCITPENLANHPTKNNVVSIQRLERIPSTERVSSTIQLSRALGRDKQPAIGATEIITEGDNGEQCRCELVSIDCLDSIKCMPKSNKRQQELISLGVTTRALMKETVTAFSGLTYYLDEFPVGKTVQYSSMEAWKEWLATKKLPQKFAPIKVRFVKDEKYPYCRKNKLIGWGCVFAGFQAGEDLHPMESEALAASPVSPDTVTAARIDLLAYHSNNRLVRETHASPPALGHLLTFAHILRMGYNLRQFVWDIYDDYHKVISHSSKGDKNNRLRVSLHMRRADSCEHQQDGYRTMASRLDSAAQMSGDRLCYDTSVYMNGLRRVEHTSGRKLDVYLSTDHAGSIMDEIKQKFPQEYKKYNWHYLDFPRETFVYEGFVENSGHDKHGELGETAIADLWHLSHGQIFVGHMGSRFCKVAWLLATARHNTFVPFRTVDGHSFCCEIDEPCGRMKPYIDSMDNCLTFSHELLGKEHEDYWAQGSLMRKAEYERIHGKPQKKKKDKKKKKQ